MERLIYFREPKEGFQIRCFGAELARAPQSPSNEGTWKRQGSRAEKYTAFISCPILQDIAFSCAGFNFSLSSFAWNGEFKYITCGGGIYSWPPVFFILGNSESGCWEDPEWRGRKLFSREVKIGLWGGLGILRTFAGSGQKALGEILLPLILLLSCPG